MVVGSFASSAHGVPRTTHDIDVVFDPTPDALVRFLAAIDPDRYYVDADTAHDALRHRGMFNIIDATIAPAVAMKKCIETMPLNHQNVVSTATVTNSVNTNIQRISRQ